MQKIGAYIIILVIGAIIGASSIAYVLLIENPAPNEQVKVTIQGITYEVTDSILAIELLNNVPEKNLYGIVVVSQDKNQWTGYVNWNFTGYGEANILCATIDKTKSFHVTYYENNPKKTYLDRFIEWNEVTISNQESTTQKVILSIVSMGFGFQEQNPYINILLKNSGVSSSGIKNVYIGTTPSNLVAQTDISYDPIDLFPEEDTTTITIQYNWVEGTIYYFDVVTEEGISLPFSAEAWIKGRMETSELTVVDVTFLDTTTTPATTADSINVTVTNSGTASVTISQVRVNGNTITAANWNMETGTTIAPGDSNEVQIRSAWTSGNKYSITFFENDGTMISSYTDTA